jgi:glyoxylase-like metal-dependent hydrolase (beta-lactamase superfamily II)
MKNQQPNLSRRSFLGQAAVSAAIVAWHPFSWPFPPQKASVSLAQMRAGAASAKITTLPLRNGLTTLMGSGGNIIVLPGHDGKLLIDSGIATSQPQLTEALNAISKDPLRHLVDTHWHFDHTDGNEWVHAAGAEITAQENTRKRLSTEQKIPAFDAVFPPSPAGAIPKVVFRDSHKMDWNGESLSLKHYAPAHTDSDISVFFKKANVLHTGDTFFNGVYPFIDYDSGGNVAGMIAATKENLSLSDAKTIVVPGHGLVGNRQSVADFSEMLSTIYDTVAALKKAGRSVEEVVAAKPTAKFDAKWAVGFITPELITRLVYRGA